MESHPHPVFIALFLAAWFTAFFSWFLTIGELIATVLFVPRVFGWGLVLLRESRALPAPSSARADPLETSGVKLKVLAPDLLLFRARSRLVQLPVQSPLSFRGRARWQGGRCEIECRTPLFPLVFFGGWLAGWTVGFVLVLRTLQPGPILGALAGYAMAGGILAVSTRIERARARTLLGELERALRG